MLLLCIRKSSLKCLNLKSYNIGVISIENFKVLDKGRVIVWFKKLFIGVFLIVSFSNSSYADVTLDYPGWVIFGEQKEYPGIPSKDIDEYKDELKNWSENYNIELLNSSLNYVNSSLDIGFSTDITVDVDGYEHILFNSDYPVADQMRDLLFLESMQNSIAAWKKKYIEPMGTAGGASLRDTYDAAFKIFSIYQEYVEKPNFRDKHSNPVVSAIFGSGSTNYGNLFETDGLIEGVVEDKIVSFGSSIASGVDLSTLSISRADVISYGTGFVIDVLNNADTIDAETTLTLQNVTTGAFGLAGGGVGLVMAPATILYNTADYIQTQLHTSAQGAHLVNFYYFSSNYPNLKDKYLDSYTGGFMDFLTLKTGADTICSDNAINNDSVAQALCNFNYGGYFSKDNTTEDEKRTAYEIGALFTLVEGFDIEAMKKEIVARVKLEELNAHSFVLLNTHLNANRYKIRLPLDVQSDATHGVPISVAYTISDNDINSTYPNAISNTKYIEDNASLWKELTFDLSAYDAIKSDQTVKATIKYADNYTVYSTTHLRFYPQIDSLELQDMPANLTPEPISLSVKFCGDESSRAQFSYKPTDGSQWYSQFFTLADPLDLGAGCKKFTIVLDGYRIYQHTRFSSVDFKVKVQSATSVTYTRNMINPDDTDADMLSDRWERDYFGSLDQNPGDDYDNDGETNYQEFIHATDPAKAGVEGIIHTIYVNNYDISGDI